jgi:hypothetical protein
MNRVHFICKGSRGVVQGPGTFVSSAWRVPLDRALATRELYLHETQRSPSYLGGAVQQVLVCPRSGRVSFVVKTSEATAEAPSTWAQVVAWSGALAQPSADAAVHRALLNVGLAICGADGISSEEAEAIRGYTAALTSLPAEEIDHALAQARSGAPADPQKVDLGALSGLDVARLNSLFREVYRAATIDGTSEKEAAAVRALAGRLGLDAERFLSEGGAK